MNTQPREFPEHDTKSKNFAQQDAFGVTYPAIVWQDLDLCRRFPVESVHASYQIGKNECTCAIMKFSDDTYDAIVYCNGEGYVVAIPECYWKLYYQVCSKSHMKNNNDQRFKFLYIQFTGKKWFSSSLFLWSLNAHKWSR